MMHSSYPLCYLKKENFSLIFIHLKLQIIRRLQLCKHLAADAARLGAGGDAARLPSSAARAALRGNVLLLNTPHVPRYLA